MDQPWVHMCPTLWTPFPPSSLYHPSGLFQGFESPVSCIELGLVIYLTYGSIHVSMLFSQIIPSLPSPRVQSLFFISVTLLLSHIWGHHCHLSKFHIYELMYCIGVFLSDIWHFWQNSSLCTIGSTFIHLIRTDSNVFFFSSIQFSHSVMPDSLRPHQK